MLTARSGQLQFLAVATAILLVFLIQESSCSSELHTYYNKVVQCEGTGSVKLDCASGYRIEILNAFFGRREKYWCVQDPFIDSVDSALNCETPGLFDFLTYFCNGKQNCSTLAADNFAGQPIHCAGGIARYIEIEYECNKMVYSGLACEASGTLPLICPDDKVLIPLSAFYGRRLGDEDTCPHTNSTVTEECQSDWALSDLQIACDGRQQCELHPTNQFFGDPCPGVYKYLEFEYTCGECRNEYIWDAMCDLWAWGGECDNNPFYMIPLCRRSCGHCASEPPQCTNYAGDSDCEYWRTEGHCEDNAAWMYPYCYKTCSGCDKSVAHTCRNEHWSDEECEERAANGACYDDPEWMYVNCWKSCTNCQKECLNEYYSDVSCMMWGANGECQRNPTWMWENCFGYCIGCTDYGCAVDFDIWDTCVEMADNGDCETNSTWMYEHCEGACTGCIGQTCTNREPDTSCHMFMLMDQCKENPGWMYQNCWKTCSGCTPDPYNLAGEKQCYEWKVWGECENNTDWMNENCWGVCTGMTIVNVGNDEQCEFWRREGKCYDDYEYMINYCAAACMQRVDVSPLDVCDNVMANDTACDAWALSGECLLNPTYMLIYCHASCARCHDDIDTANFTGRPPLPGDRTDFTQAKTFIVPGEFEVSANLTHFTGFFVNQDEVRLDIWRPQGNNYFELVYGMTVQAHGNNISQTMMPTECVELQPGDKLGFTAFTNVSPLAQIYDFGVTASTYFRNANSRSPFIELTLPYLFSLGAFYNDNTYYCSSSFINDNNNNNA